MAQLAKGTTIGGSQCVLEGEHKHEVHLPIVTVGTFSYSGTYETIDYGILRWVSQNYAGYNVHFEVILEGDGGATAYARLYNETDGQGVSGSELSTTSTNWARLRSGALTMPSGEKDLKLQLRTSDTNYWSHCHMARLILVPA